MPVSEAWLQITDGDWARAHSNRVAHTALPFEFIPAGINGTQLMLQFLGNAEERGAHYASNLAIILQMTHNGGTVECVSKVILDDGKPHEPPPPDAAAETTPTDEVNTTTIHPWHPAQVTAQVDDHVFVCARKAETIAAVQPVMNDEYQAEQKRFEGFVEIPKAMIVTSEWRDSCHLEPRHREVTRYEHFVAAHFEPPDWTKLASAFADRKLIELPPECHQIATPAKTIQRVEGDLGYDGTTPAISVKPLSRPKQTR
jgi:hypothetical protein